MTPLPNSLQASVRRLVLTGLAIFLTVIVGAGGWAMTTEISGAVIATGELVVKENTKKVQHQAGGIVGEILVRNGDVVAPNQVLLRLDATVTRANLAIVDKRLSELYARQARLAAERDGHETIAFPEMLTGPGATPEMQAAARGEQRLFDLRRTTREGQKQQLSLRIEQIERAIEGLGVQAKAKTDEIAFIERELKGAKKLWKKGLMPITRLTALEREATRTRGESGNLTSSIAGSHAQVAETRLQLIQIDRQLASEVARELREVEAQIGEFVERKVTAEAELSRVEIRAPAAGIVHDSSVDTVGGVISPGQTLMEIVPKVETLTIDARVNPSDIDQIQPSQAAVLRLTAFNQRTTPEFEGLVERVSPTVMVDDQLRQSYYMVRIKLDETQLGTSIPIDELKPGMPVEAYFKTGDRSVMSYLMKPLADQFQRAFREE